LRSLPTASQPPRRPAPASSSRITIEGSSNSKALEIFNGAGALIDLAAEGYRVEF
jgi:hypothetical protein